jgi:hypothetical protein
MFARILSVVGIVIVVTAYLAAQDQGNAGR